MLDRWGFVYIYDDLGQYALSAWAAILTILFAQLCFQSAACGCVQRCSDDRKNCAERLGHLFLFLMAFPAMMPIPFMWKYIMDNDLLGTVALNFVLTKGGSMIGALFLMSCLWYILWTMQSNTDREGRMGVDTFYIQWDAVSYTHLTLPTTPYV